MNEIANYKNKKRPGTIVSAEVKYDTDHDFWTFWAQVNFECFDTAFGGLVFEDEIAAVAFAAELLAVFGVAELDDLAGVQCYGLWCLGEHNEPMEGIGSLTSGKRLTITGFRRRHYPNNAKSALDRERDRLHNTLRWAERRAVDAEDKLASLTERHTEWETAPSWQDGPP